MAGVGEPNFVLVHGLASTRRVFDLMVPLLSRAHRVIAYDQRGHGESEKPDEGYALDDLVADLEELLRRHGVSRPVLVGHSSGANVALRHAVTHRAARGLVLVDGAMVELHAHMSWEEAAEVLVPTPDDPAAIERWTRQGGQFLAGSEQLVEIRRSLFEWLPNGTVRKRLGRDRHLRILRGLWEHDAHADLRAVGCPTLVVPCRMDVRKLADQPFLRQKELAAARIARIPNVTVSWAEDAVHDLPLQRPRELAQTILTFVAGL